MIMPLKAFKYFSIGKIIFFPFACLWSENLKPGKMMFLFSEILIHTTVDFSHKKNVGFRLEFALYGSSWNIHMIIAQIYL